jgi:hypothetical protein
MLRRLVCAGAIVLLITGGAGAQSNSNAQSPLSITPFKPKAPPPSQEQTDRQKAADKAYEAAIHKIPDKKSSADPWSDVRPAKSKQQ